MCIHVWEKVREIRDYFEGVTNVDDKGIGDRTDSDPLVVTL